MKRDSENWKKRCTASGEVYTPYHPSYKFIHATREKGGYVKCPDCGRRIKYRKPMMCSFPTAIMIPFHLKPKTDEN